MSQPDVLFQRLVHGADLPLPQIASAGAAGADLTAALEASIEIAPGERKLIPTGFAMALPDGFEAQIRPRSGLALKQGLTVLNAPGTIDADYRGEVGVILINHGSDPAQIQRGDRIAQMVIAPVPKAIFREVASLPDSQRGTDGFGSTGVQAAGVNSKEAGSKEAGSKGVGA